MADPDLKVQVPSSAVAATDDLLAPAAALLGGLNLLPSAKDLKGAGGLRSAFQGPPDSVSLIEAGATAANKWWAAGLGAGVIAAWAAVRGWWDGAPAGTQHVALWVAAVVTAAGVLGIAYLLGSDVRGRAAVATETVRARATIAEAFIRAAVSTQEGAAGAGADGRPVVPLPALAARNVTKAGAEETGWTAIALRTDGVDETRYLLVKGAVHEWVAAAQVELV
ncbi:hypothetical protein AB0M20_41680 [Actinoplanes sp. NPDC051633]|uniref:hypothetical protein n=1 Tax=Actinoplanes sp. NPDC051633 TaxID=3155670 RepID=UPI00341A64EA